MKVVIAFITYNTLKYTKLCLKSIKCSSPHEILVIDNGSIDGTQQWLKEQKVTLIENNQNLGVPYASNIMYDYTWKDDKDNLLVVISNDMVCLPTSIDDLVKAASISDAPAISGDTIASPVYLMQHPEDRRFFAGGTRINPHVRGYETWSPGKWYNLNEKTQDEFISTMYSKMIPLLPKLEVVGCHGHGWYIPGHRIYKYKYFESTGYWDVNFYPLYSMDFDMAMRSKLTNTSCSMLYSSLCFEFWSRALYEGVGPVVDARRDDYYREKWGPNAVDTTGWSIPFNGSFPAKYAGYDTSQVRISSRVGELERIKSLMGSKFHGTVDPKIASTIDGKYYG